MFNNSLPCGLCPSITETGGYGPLWLTPGTGLSIWSVASQIEGMTSSISTDKTIGVIIYLRSILIWRVLVGG